jgi:hypothetical protein
MVEQWGAIGFSTTFFSLMMAGSWEERICLASWPVLMQRQLNSLEEKWWLQYFSLRIDTLVLLGN